MEWLNSNYKILEFLLILLKHNVNNYKVLQSIAKSIAKYCKVCSWGLQRGVGTGDGRSYRPKILKEISQILKKKSLKVKEISQILKDISQILKEISQILKELSPILMEISQILKELS